VNLETLLRGIVLLLLLVMSYYLGERLIMVVVGFAVMMNQLDLTNEIPFIEHLIRGGSLLLAGIITYKAYCYLEVEQVVPYE
jgi:hypothetical protein